MLGVEVKCEDEGVSVSITYLLVVHARCCVVWRGIGLIIQVHSTYMYIHTA